MLKGQDHLVWAEADDSSIASIVVRSKIGDQQWKSVTKIHEKWRRKERRMWIESHLLENKRNTR